MGDFKGFPKETVKFFEDLKKNNSKEWFEAHKKDYEQYVKRPAEDFVIAMGKKLQQLSPHFRAIPKVNQSLFRINRDTRFSNDKTPYKTNLGIWFWEGERKRMECTGFYFHFGDGNLMLGAGMHVFSKENLARFRKAVVHKQHGPQLKKTISAISRNGYAVHGRHYKRIPQGFGASHKLSEFLLYSGLSAMTEGKIPKEFYASAIVNYVFSHFKKMYPLHEWLLKAVG